MRLSYLLPLLFFMTANWHARADSFFDVSDWYVSPMLSYVDDGTSRNVDDGLSGYHIGFGKDLDDSLSVEFSGVLAYYNADGFDADQEQWGLGVDIISRYQYSEHFVPYLLAGAGYINTKHDNPLRNEGGGLMTSIGAGILTPIRVFDLKLRTELRYRADFNGDTEQDVLLSFGLQRALKPKPPRLVDSDNDGVADSDDRCEDTPAGAETDRYGCVRSKN